MMELNEGALAMSKKAWMLYVLAISSQDFNGLIAQTERSQKTAHNQALHSTTNAQTALSYNTTWEKLRARASLETHPVSVKITQK